MLLHIRDHLAEAIDRVGPTLFEMPMTNMKGTPTENASLKHGTKSALVQGFPFP